MNTQPKSLLVYGPRRSDLTTHAYAIARHFGLQRIVEEAHALRAPAFKRQVTQQPTLFLTHQPIAQCDIEIRHVRVMHIDEALQHIGMAGKGAA